ncbi:MAG TPA: hypothetical protein PK299_13315 [Anaerolineales bacterium]|nr:hypothetical protein [Anaerolineales bacterium]
MQNLKQLKPKFSPTLLGLIIGVVIGGLIGLLYGWVVEPVRWYDTDPNWLREDYRSEWVSMMADSFAINSNLELARQRMQVFSSENQAVVISQAMQKTTDPNRILNLKGQLQIPDATPDQLQKGFVLPASSNNWGVLLLCGIATLLGLGAIYLAYAKRQADRYDEASLQPNTVVEPEVATPVDEMDYQPEPEYLEPEPAEESHSYAGTATPTRSGGTTSSMRAASASQATVAGGANVSGTPIAQFMTTYRLGDDLYDDSFTIDDPTGDFLGECGVGIGETIGVSSDVNKVSAFEVWLFDKNDIRTVTKVLMSEHLYYDEAARARLATKGEPHLIMPKSTVIMETATLVVRGRIVDAQYGSGGAPERSYFEQVTLELTAYKK